MRPSLVLCATALALSCSPSLAQQAPANGPRAVHAGWHALVHGTAVTSPGQSVLDATIVIRDGRILSVAPSAAPPKGARIWDCSGLTIYAGLIEPFYEVDAPPPDPKAPGTHWSPKITPQRHALDGEGLDEKKRKALRDLGFGAVAIAPAGGIFRGSSALVLTGTPGEGEGHRAVVDKLFQSVAFDRGGSYPGSEMGVLAAMRQALHDADWYDKARSRWSSAPDLNREPELEDAPAALVATKALPMLFQCEDELQLLRAHKIATEFGRSAIALGSGLEFRRVDAVASTGVPVFVPVDFPDAPDVSTLARAESVSLRDLLTWENAPTNPRRLRDKGVKAAFTSARLTKPSEFHAGVRKAIAAGLRESEALAMLTVLPAEILGVGDRLGTIDPNKIANLVVVDGSLFDEKAKIRSVWVEGRHHLVSRKQHDMDGKWRLALSVADAGSAEITIDGSSVNLLSGDKKVAATKIKRVDRHLSFVVEGESFGMKGKVTLGGHVEPRGFFGRGFAPDGKLFQFVGTRTGDLDKKDKDKEKVAKATPEAPAEPAKLALPFGAYGLMEVPAQEDFLIYGATVWTSGPKGTISSGAVWVREGKVAWVGSDSDLPADLPGDTKRIDATGKHITPGLIDCHSHTGISRGINESRQTVTSEVRIADVVNPDDIAWYRELAGGLTAVNQLHGSANPIGGQNHVAKIRWGVRHPDEMSLKGAPGGIKFALGENPKRAGGTRGRYPGSRLGVAALIRDRFVAAKEYDAAWRRFEAVGNGANGSAVGPLPPRRDLELDAIAEILRGERLIHCHSYRHDEILMLCKTADEFGFKIGTLQHVLEGYKVADAIKKSARGASSFSDWWAYKMEVIDAIPFNGEIMHNAGVVVSFNSDSSELARRMNTEAGKAVKYGNVPPAEALKFVTLNPAIQLGVEDKIGSLEKGKHADLAVWSGDPLSYRSICEATYVDGRAYFTLERDRHLRIHAAKERQRLLQLALAAKKTAPPRGGGRRRRSSRYNYVDALYSCCTQQGGR